MIFENDKTAGAYNWSKGKWNPSPDSHRYDSSNSITGME